MGIKDDKSSKKKKDDDSNGNSKWKELLEKHSGIQDKCKKLNIFKKKEKK